MPKQAPVTFNIPMFDKAVDDLGLPIILESAIVCSCVNPSTGHPDFSCKRCMGTGVDYLPPTEQKAVVSGMGGSEKLLNVPGMIIPGTAYCTTKSTVILGWRDRLTFPDIHSKFSENLKFLNGELQIPRKYIKTLLAARLDGEDLSLDKFKLENNRLVYSDPDKPLSEGSTVSVLYYTSPRYVVENMMHELRASISSVKSATPYVAELPKQAQIKREDFVFVDVSTTERIEEVPVSDPGNDSW